MPSPDFPPPSQPPPPNPMNTAASAIGRAIIGNPIKIGDGATIFGAPMTLISDGNKVPSYQPTADVQAYRWTGTAWSLEGPASATCSDGICRLTIELQHASTWSWRRFPPDLTAPALTGLQISEDGLTWRSPGELIQTTARAGEHKTLVVVHAVVPVDK